MSEPVKRNYSSTLRETQASETRRVIVSAATRLFIEQGFGRTTIDAIAAAAGVSRKTVFTSAGGKADILKLALDWAVVGDDRPVPLSRRSAVERLKKETDPATLVEGWIEMGVGISARVAGIYGALVVAAGIDDDARDLLETARAQRLAGARAIVRALDALGALRPDLSVDEAADIAWTLGDPTLYEDLVVHRRWSQRRFKTWMTDTAARQLLAAAPSCQK
ncbi:MAG TPA: helix-turn-helix domain-containing protein [Nocardioidaceae bacterium]|jgi:AcrR family transcriptional regulator